MESGARPSGFRLPAQEFGTLLRAPVLALAALQARGGGGGGGGGGGRYGASGASGGSTMVTRPPVPRLRLGFRLRQGDQQPEQNDPCRMTESASPLLTPLHLNSRHEIMPRSIAENADKEGPERTLPGHIAVSGDPPRVGPGAGPCRTDPDAGRERHGLPLLRPAGDVMGGRGGTGGRSRERPMAGYRLYWRSGDGLDGGSRRRCG